MLNQPSEKQPDDDNVSVDSLGSMQHSDIDPVTNKDLKKVEPPVSQLEMASKAEHETDERPKTGTVPNLSTRLGKTPIGSPSYVNVHGLTATEVPMSDKAKQFKDPESHLGRPPGYKNVLEFEREHFLKKKFNNSGWNNIPLGIKDMF